MIRVNSQSGKGGVAYIMKSDHKLDLPRRLQMEFSRVVQQQTDSEGGEVSPSQMWDVFRRTYLDRTTPLQLNSHHTSSAQGELDRLEVNVYVEGEPQTLEGSGNGPIAAFVAALSGIGYDVRVLDYAEHALSSGGDAIAAAYVECAVGDQVLWGVGMDANIVTASLKAVRLRGQPRLTRTPPGHLGGLSVSPRRGARRATLGANRPCARSGSRAETTTMTTEQGSAAAPPAVAFSSTNWGRRMAIVSLPVGLDALARAAHPDLHAASYYYVGLGIMLGTWAIVLATRGPSVARWVGWTMPILVLGAIGLMRVVPGADRPGHPGGLPGDVARGRQATAGGGRLRGQRPGPAGAAGPGLPGRRHLDLARLAAAVPGLDGLRAQPGAGSPTAWRGHEAQLHDRQVRLSQTMGRLSAGQTLNEAIMNTVDVGLVGLRSDGSYAAVNDHYQRVPGHGLPRRPPGACRAAGMGLRGGRHHLPDPRQDPHGPRPARGGVHRLPDLGRGGPGEASSARGLRPTGER